MRQALPPLAALPLLLLAPAAAQDEDTWARLALPLDWRRLGCRIESTRDPAHPDVPAWGLTPAVQAAWAALPPPTPTDCPLETWRLRAVRDGRAEIEDAEGNLLTLERGDAVGGAWTISAWVPAWRVRRVEGEALVLDSLLHDEPPRRWTVGDPVQRPTHRAWTPGEADLAFDREVAARGWSAAPSAAVKAALLSLPGEPLSRVRAACAEGGQRCLVRADVRSTELLAEVLRALPPPAAVLAVAELRVELPPSRPCRRGDEVSLRTAVLELGSVGPAN